MAYQGISTGTVANDGLGDSLLTGAVKINSNFTEIYSALGDGSTLSVNSKVGFSTVITIPSSSILGPTVSQNNGLFILEGPTSFLSLNNTFSIGTRFSVISKNSTNVIRPAFGTLIMGFADDLILDSNYYSFDIVWTGPTFGWAIK